MAPSETENSAYAKEGRYRSAIRTCGSFIEHCVLKNTTGIYTMP